MKLKYPFSILLCLIGVHSFAINPVPDLGRFSNHDIKLTALANVPESSSPLSQVDPYQPNPAIYMGGSKGVIIADDGQGTRFVSQISDGDWILVKGVNFGAKGAKRFTAKISGQNAAGTFEVRLDSRDLKTVCKIDIGAAGNAGSWQECAAFADNAEGIHDIYFVFKAEKSVLINFLSWQFEEKHTIATAVQNPIIQTKLTADPAPMVHNGTVYLYTSRDQAPVEGGMGNFQMFEWLLYTSEDMVNWTDHGVVASLKSFSTSVTNGAWAPQCIERNGKFYLYCPVHGHGISVLVSDSPYGPFKDPLGKPLVNQGWHDIDPTILIDDDGQAYLYWGNPDLYYVRLNKDMISYSGEIVKEPRLQHYQEGPWAYKRNGKYYMAYASTCCPEGIGYAMGDKPSGTWQYRGHIMDPDSRSSGNHPGIIDFKGNSYVFGFDYALYYSPGTRNVHAERRSICVEKITFNSDGTINKLPFWSDTGVDPVGTINPYKKVQAETISWSEGLETEQDSEAGMVVTSVHDGDYMKVRSVDFGKKIPKSFLANVKSLAGGSIEIWLDSPGSATLLGTVKVDTAEKGWKNLSVNVEGRKGIHDVYFVFRGDTANALLMFDYWQFK